MASARSAASASEPVVHKAEGYKGSRELSEASCTGSIEVNDSNMYMFLLSESLVRKLDLHEIVSFSVKFTYKITQKYLQAPHHEVIGNLE